VNPARKGLASHRYSALEGSGRPVSVSVGGGASRPKAIAEGVEPSHVGKHHALGENQRNVCSNLVLIQEMGALLQPELAFTVFEENLDRPPVAV